MSWTLIVFALKFPAGFREYSPPMVAPGFLTEQLCHDAAQEMEAPAVWYQNGAFKAKIIHICVRAR
jgi:hypothetical protein